MLAQLALAGVTNPLPTELNLLQGEEGRFKFQIQAVNSENDLNCVAKLKDESVFSIDFDPAEILVEAGSVQDVYGTVDTSRKMDYGTYQEEFCIVCIPVDGPTGAAVAVETCGLPLKVNVVEERGFKND